MRRKRKAQAGWRRRALRLVGLASLFLGSGLLGAHAQNNSAEAHGLDRNGQHDFDFLVGSWKIHLKRRLHPLTGSNTWVEFDGTDVARRIWDGADLDEFETDSPSGHIEGLTLRTYNPQTHQWSLYWANREDGSMSLSPQIGEFKDGRGEFYAQDTLNGKLIYVRYAWSNTATNTPHFEQAYSNDGGKTWEVNWITDQTRVPDDSIKPYDAPAESNAGTQAAAGRDGQHDFDPLLGDWKFDLKVRQHPLTGSTTWVEYGGNGACHKVWNGRANQDWIALNSPSGPIEGLTLRLYNPQTRQWSLYWANRKDGKVVVPQIGQFKDGHGEFYAQDMFDGKSIFVRFGWTNFNTSPHFEQAFSDDGGQTWEVNWTSNQTKIDGEDAKER